MRHLNPISNQYLGGLYFVSGTIFTHFDLSLGQITGLKPHNMALHNYLALDTVQIRILLEISLLTVYNMTIFGKVQFLAKFSVTEIRHYGNGQVGEQSRGSNQVKCIFSSKLYPNTSF